MVKDLNSLRVLSCKHGGINIFFYRIKKEFNNTDYRPWFVSWIDWQEKETLRQELSYCIPKYLFPLSSLFLSCPFLSSPERNRGALFLFCPWWTDAEEQLKSLNSPMLHLRQHIFPLTLGNWTTEIVKMKDCCEAGVWSSLSDAEIMFLSYMKELWCSATSLILMIQIPLSNSHALFIIYVWYLSWIVCWKRCIYLMLIMSSWFPSHQNVVLRKN